MTTGDLPDDQLLECCIRSMPEIYQEASGWIEPPSEWAIKESLFDRPQHATQVLHISIDMVRFLAEAFRDVKPFALGFDHRMTIHRWLSDCFENGQRLEHVLSNASNHSVQLFREVEGFLLGGSMKVAECIRQLSETERSFFIDVVMKGTGPTHFVHLLHERAPEADVIFHDAVQELINLSEWL